MSGARAGRRLDRQHLVEPALVAWLARERRGQERDGALDGGLDADDPGPEASGCSCRRARRPGAPSTCRGRSPPGCPGSCWPRPTLPRRTRRSGCRGRRGRPARPRPAPGRSPGSRRWVRAVAAEVGQLVRAAELDDQPPDQLVLERGPGVVRGERDAHPVLSRGPGRCPGCDRRRHRRGRWWGGSRGLAPSVAWRPCRPSRTTRRPTSATRSAVKPNSLKIVPAGALAPKWSSPMIAPSSPTQRSQPIETPISTETRFLTDGGRTESRYASSCASNRSQQGRLTTRDGMPVGLELLGRREGELQLRSRPDEDQLGRSARGLAQDVAAAPQALACVLRRCPPASAASGG